MVEQKSESNIGIEDIKLPYTVKNVILMAPGVWNDITFTDLVIEKGTKEMEFTKENSSLFLDHNDNSIPAWVGDITNIKYDTESKNQMGDMNLVEKETAMKVAYGAKFGISPKLDLVLDKNNKMLSFKVMNYSLVINPAIKEAYINNDEGEAKMSEEVEFAKWSTAEINDLPDSSFLYIAPGGKKDESGNTVPRSLRYLPYKDKNGKVDLPHLRNAIARAPQADIPESVIKEVQDKARSILEKESGGKNMSEEKKFADEYAPVLDAIKGMVSKGMKIDEILGMLNDMVGECMPEEMACKKKKNFAADTPLKDAGTIVTGNGEEGVEKVEKLNLSNEQKDENAAKLSEAYKTIETKDALLREKEELVGKFMNEAKELQMRVKVFEDEKAAELEKVRKAQFDNDVNVYSRFYGKPTEEVAQRLATFSDDARKVVIEDITAKESQMVSVGVEQTGLNSEQLNGVATMSEQPKEITREDVIKELFNKLKR